MKQPAGQTVASKVLRATRDVAADQRLGDVLGYQLALARLTTSAVFEREVGEPLGLRQVEYTILALIGENPGMTPAGLAKALDVTAPNITAWMAKLESRGLIARTASDTDRRVQVLRLTTSGAQLSAEATRRLIDCERAALADLSTGEFVLLNELLRKVAAARVR
jgi:DNA-binding MarR family transcriptional regulator